MIIVAVRCQFYKGPVVSQCAPPRVIDSAQQATLEWDTGYSVSVIELNWTRIAAKSSFQSSRVPRHVQWALCHVIVSKNEMHEMFFQLPYITLLGISSWHIYDCIEMIADSSLALNWVALQFVQLRLGESLHLVAIALGRCAAVQLLECAFMLPTLYVFV